MTNGPSRKTLLTFRKETQRKASRVRRRALAMWIVTANVAPGQSVRRPASIVALRSVGTQAIHELAANVHCLGC